MEEKKLEAPVSKPEFKRYWDLFIGDVAKRDNFKAGHLEQLRVLCQLYTEYDKLTEDIEEIGFTYETDPNGTSRYGNQIKINPSATQRDKILSEIRQYSKLLNLVLYKDEETKKPEAQKSEWD